MRNWQIASPPYTAGWLAGIALFGAAQTLPAAGQPPISLTLTADPSSAPVHQTIHFTASLPSQGASTAVGSVIFSDGGSVIATVPFSPAGTAVLGDAALTPGTHVITAAYSSDAANGPSASAAVTVTIIGTPASFTVTADPAAAYVNSRSR